MAPGPGPRGQSTASGRAGHGSTSPYEVSNTLIAAGPEFRQAGVSATDSGNVDIAPTLMQLAGVATPAHTFDGRVLEEALRASSRPLSAVAADGLPGGTVAIAGAYSVEQRVTVVDGVRYFLQATATRAAPPR